MTTSNLASSTVGWAALATGIVSILAVVLIILFYVVGGPFGTLNDIFNGVAGILSGVLAWVLFSKFRLPSPILQATLLLAMIGSIVVVVGSILIIFDFTGWVLAGWYTTVGNALIGIWLLAFSNSVQRSNMLPHNLSSFGIIVGALMTVGIIAILGIIPAIDSMESTPWYVSLGFVGFLGTYLLYPIWAIWLGRTLLAKH